MNKKIITVLLFIIITACDKSVEPINYGEDQCDYCSMGIVQKTHAAQLVTQKGKQHKFDAVECMVNYIKVEPEKFENATLLVSNYNHPADMIPAENSAFLITENIPSPMGANLSAFASMTDAVESQNKWDGKVYQWEELKDVIKTEIHKLH